MVKGEAATGGNGSVERRPARTKTRSMTASPSFPARFLGRGGRGRAGGAFAPLRFSRVDSSGGDARGTAADRRRPWRLGFRSRGKTGERGEREQGTLRWPLIHQGMAAAELVRRGRWRRARAAWSLQRKKQEERDDAVLQKTPWPPFSCFL